VVLVFGYYVSLYRSRCASWARRWRSQRTPAISLSVDASQRDRARARRGAGLADLAVRTLTTRGRARRIRARYSNFMFIT
jgi:hypothetical protein